LHEQVLALAKKLLILANTITLILALIPANIVPARILTNIKKGTKIPLGQNLGIYPDTYTYTTDTDTDTY